MIKVLVVETSAFGYDGITNVITNYYTYQDHSKIKMDLVTINPVSKGFREVLDSNESVNYVLPYRNANPVKYVFALAKILKKGQYQILHTHGNSATMAVEMLAAFLAGVKVRIAHSHNTKCDHVKADKLLRPIFNALYTHGCACGKEAGEWLFGKKTFDVISNGINLEKFQYNEMVRKELRDKYDLSDRLVIGHVGRFSEQKNHEKLVDVFEQYSQRVPEAKLVLVGDGELRQQIEARTQTAGLDVLFVGLSDEVEKWLQAIDVIVFPSLFEGLPLGLVEAQCAALPCVLSDTISPATKLTDLVDFVPLSTTADVWCDHIQDMVNKHDRAVDKDTVIKQIQNAHFDIQKNCEDLAQWYELLANKTCKRRTK